jgi:hypothetical protein
MWIDALCINQDDLDERARQVAFMGDIYETAERVVVWLGEDKGHALTGTRLLHKAAEYARQETGENFPEIGVLAQEIFDSPLKLFRELLDPGHADWLHVGGVFGVDWFTRVWILQEVTRGREVMVVMGITTIDWKHLVVGCRWLRAKNYMHLLHSKYGRAGSGGDNLAFQDRSHDIARSITAASSFNATDPWDKIFAVLVLRSTVSKNLSSASPLWPNYRKQVAYADVVQYLIRAPLDGFPS